jgi:cell volume regulation protein A
LRTDLSMFRLALAPASVLATVGVVLTALIVAAAAVWILDLPPLMAMLLASIVSSTDAAAVFAVFRSRGMRVRQRLAATLEIESGANDPMAVLLTVACLEILVGRLEPGWDVALLFARQLVLGGVIGLGIGYASSVAITRIRLDAPGLYPVLAASSGLLAYGAAAVVGGSGFLAVYLAGLTLGARGFPFRRGVFMFHDGLAWLSQITMFVLLGLLSFPSRLPAAAGPALLFTATLIFLARPLAVALCTWPFRFSVREVAFIGWGGLKGAVPVILSTYPLMLGLPNAEGIFDVVFFVVLASTVTQGWSLPYAARLLGLLRPPVPEPPAALEITTLRDVNGEIVEYTLSGDTLATGRRIRDLALPQGALVAMVVRDKQVIPPRGSTELRPADHVFVLLQPGARWLVDRVFSSTGDARAAIPVAEFPLRGETRCEELEEFYGIRVDAPPGATLDEVLRARLSAAPATGDTVTIGMVQLIVRETVDGKIETVGLSVDASTETS